MKKAFIILVIFGGFLALSFTTPVAVSAQTTDSPAATEDAGDSGFFSSVFENIAKGFQAVWDMITEWFTAIVRILSGEPTERVAPGECGKASDCQQGFSCLNACPEDDPDCGVFIKRCLEGVDEIEVQPEFNPCDDEDLCEEGTFCTRTCPDGVECDVERRCLAPETGEGACRTDGECQVTCAERTFPASAVGAWESSCTEGSCRCLFREIDPDLAIAECPDDKRNIVCPQGAAPACTEERGPLRLTCLTAPAFGGQCLRDTQCGNVNCAEGSTPFCADDQRCRCRRVEETSVSCTNDTDCEGLSCADGDPSTCREEVCTCERTVEEEQDLSCQAEEDCEGISCQEGYDPACVDGRCACQRVREDAPVECASVEDCGGVSCPEEFEKICLDGVCACTRTKFE